MKPQHTGTAPSPPPDSRRRVRHLFVDGGHKRLAEILDGLLGELRHLAVINLPAGRGAEAVHSPFNTAAASHLAVQRSPSWLQLQSRWQAPQRHKPAHLISKCLPITSSALPSSAGKPSAGGAAVGAQGQASLSAPHQPHCCALPHVFRHSSTPGEQRSAAQRIRHTLLLSLSLHTPPS